MKRRSFIKNSLATGAVFSIVPSSVVSSRNPIKPNDKIQIGIIGVGKQGWGLARNFVQNELSHVVAGSDVWDVKNEGFKKDIEARSGLSGSVRTYKDYRELIANPEVDAVVIGTPDHWHAIQAIEAMVAGKDVYCEKPMTHRIDEGRQLVETSKQTGRVVQVGSMQRSDDNFRNACEIVRSGYLGNIQKILVNVGDPAVDYNLPVETTPSGLDWNMWCGPAPLIHYNNRIAPPDTSFFPDWRFFHETGGGILTDWGAHMFDIVQWALGTDHTGPVEYIPPSDKNAKRGLRMIYDNGIEMVHEDFGRGWGVRFIGSKAQLDISRGYFDVSDPSLKEKQEGRHLLYRSQNQIQDFLEAMHRRSVPICPAEIGHRSASIGNIANIAYQIGKPLKWDPVSEKFNKSKANKLISRNNRQYLV